MQQVGVDRERRLAALVLGDGDLVLLRAKSISSSRLLKAHSRHGAMILMPGSSA